MSLATRCASCGTVFRVVQDQLKVSEGWVRCGRCDSVFNALEGLFDLGRDEPAEAAAPATATAAVRSPAAPPASPMPAQVDIRTDGEPDADADRHHDDTDDELVPALWNEGPPSALDELLADPIDGHIFRERARADEVGERDRLEFSDARFDSDLFEENAGSAEVEAVAAPTTDAAALPLESTIRPDFVRRAERRAVWHSTPVRAALAGASVLAVLALLLQVGHHFRDVLAGQSPELRPMLVAWCAVAGCTLQAPRRLEDIVVDNSGVTRASSGDAFVLTVNLRNHGGLAVMMPSVDLNLTDGNGKQIARRALSPRDFHAADVLQAQAETTLQLMLTAGGARIAGYNIEIFYP